MDYETKERVKDLINKGLTASQIADSIHYSANYVRQKTELVLGDIWTKRLRMNGKKRQEESKKYATQWGRGAGWGIRG
jgi:orotate phosphoribosyltransferase-like protein